MSDKPKDGDAVPDVSGKKPYHRPTLDVHGTIREVTAHVGNLSSKVDPPPFASGKFTTH
jgi:hypothetical protein